MGIEFLPIESLTGRLFLALWPDADVQARLSALQASCSFEGRVRRTAAHDMHVTLHFIGAVPKDKLSHIQGALQTRIEPFEFELDQLTQWTPEFAVVVASRVPPEMQRLHEGLAEELRALELPVEARRYQPHVTIARSATMERGALQHPIEPIKWTASGYALAMWDGGAYRLIERFGRLPR